MANDSTDRKSVPSVAFRSLVTFLDHLHSVGVPNTINKSVFTNSFSGGTASLILRALRDFETIDESGKPNRTLLEPFVDPATRRTTLRTLMDSTYDSLIALPVSQASPGEVKAWFDNLGMDAQTARKAQTFFVHAAEEAGIDLHKMVAGKKRRSPGPRRKARAKSNRGEDVSGGAGSSTNGIPQNVAVDNALPARYHKAVVGWLEELPEPGSDWAREDFNMWLSTFTTMLERLYKIPTSRKKPQAVATPGGFEE